VSYRDVLIDDDFSLEQRQNCSEGKGAAIHEDCTDRDQAFACSRRFQHNIPCVCAENVFPILLDMLQTSPEFIIAKYENAILTDRHEVVEEKRDRLESNARRFCHQPVKDTRYNVAREENVGYTDW